MQVERGRIGQFFLYIGMISLVIFFTTDRSLHPGVEFFFIGLVSSAVGVFLIWRGFKPPQESRRLRIFRKKKNKSEEPSSREQ